MGLPKRQGKRGCVVVFISTAIVMGRSPSLAAAEVSGKSLKTVEALFDADEKDHPLGAMTVGVVSGSRLIWTKSYGLADIKAGKSPDSDTVYRIGSITKQFTALMYLQLRQQGIVSDTDFADSCFPAIKQVKGDPEEIDKITLEELATHRAGLSREPDDIRYLAGPIEAWESSLAAAMPHVALEFAQGDMAHYSNVGYAVLGACLEVAAKKPYIDYISSNILRPLGMNQSGFILTADMKAHLARGYLVNNGVGDAEVADTELQTGRGYKIPNGGLFSTVGDMAKFVSLELGTGPATVLDAKSLQLWQSKFYPMPPHGTYGIAMTKHEVNGRRQLGHNGAVGGFVAFALFDPDAKVGVICLRNTDRSYGGCGGKVVSAALDAVASSAASQ